MNASKLFGIKVEDVTPQQRQASKALTFGLVYGKGANSLARDLGKTKEEVQGIFKLFDKEFPNAGEWLKMTPIKAQTTLYSCNPFQFEETFMVIY